MVKYFVTREYLFITVPVKLTGDGVISPAVCIVFLSYSGRNDAVTLYVSK